MKLTSEDRLDLGEILKEAFENDLLLEGGAAKHIMRLYEDGKMTFGEMRQIFQDVFQGKTTLVEKCLAPDTKLMLEENGEMSICDIVNKKIKDNVLTIDTDGNQKFLPITDWFNNGEKDDWVVITLEDGTKITCTPEHKFICDDLKQEKTASELKVEDYLVVSH